jgi:hypothetical protein
MFRLDETLFTNYKRVLFAYCLLLFGLMSPFFLFGEVAAPHRQYIETGSLSGHAEAQHIENHKFSDYTNAYIPEVSLHLNGARSGWVTLWSNQNELGRPVYQISGFSPAYLPSYIIAQLTTSPWQFITALSLLTCFFAGIFIIFFCREVGLSPLAGLIAGSSLGASPLFMYWLTFPMFPAVWCWAAGALWGVTRLAKRLDLVGWSILAFSVYSLLMTAYPQPVVFHAYILAAYGLYLVYHKLQHRSFDTGRFLLLSASAVFVGAALALPVYIDLVNLAAESARVAPDPSFFTKVLPKISSLSEAVRFFVLSTSPELFGNPIETGYPFSYDGLSVTPLIIFFAVISLLAAFRKTWGWWLAIVVLCLFAFIHPLYILGVKFLGFNLSRSTPLGSIMLPLTVIVAYGVDALIKRSIPGQLSGILWIAVTSILAVLLLGVGFGFSQAIDIRWGMVLVGLVLVGLLATQLQKTQPALLLLALITVLATTSYPLMLRQDPARIAIKSPLIEKVSANLAVGSRFAITAPGIQVLPPNLNAGLGLASVHSYNSLSSRRYHTLIKALGGEVQTYGRSNATISPDYDSTMFWMSNISLMLSPKKLRHKNLVYLGEESSVYFYKVTSRMGESLQVALPLGHDETQNSLELADFRLDGPTPSKLLDQGDQLEFKVAPGAPSVLILSQKFHRDWQAKIFDKSGWAPAKTTVINGVFQGVLLSQGVSRVRLEFKPYARYAWIAHIFWLSLLVLTGFKGWSSRMSLKGEGVSTG